MSGRYSPVPPMSDANPANYAFEEFMDLARAMSESQESLLLQELNVAPEKPRDGMIVLADGTNWNPGFGAGYYGYRDGDWRLLDTSVTIYTAATVTKNTGGTATGTIADTTTMLDGNVYSVVEAASTPGFDIEFEWSGITRDPTELVVRALYSGSASHSVTVDIYRYSGTPGWDKLSELTTSLDYRTLVINLPAMTNYLSSGVAKVRIYHNSAGNVSHNISIDYIALISSGGGGVNVSVSSDVIWDAKGDLAVGTGSDTATRLGVGNNDYALVAASGETTGVKWAGFLQAGTGAVTRTWQNKLRDTVSAKDFGALGDGSTNDHTALTAWITALKTLDAPLAILPDGTYAIGDNTLTFDLPDNSVMIFAGAFTSTAVNKSAVIIGKSSGNAQSYVVIGLKVARSSIDYTGQSVGIELLNLAWSDVDIRACTNFRIGVMGHGNGYGFTYNTIKLGLIHDNRINMQLAVSNTPGGYCNECTWIGGSLNHSSSYDVATYNGLNLEIPHNATNSVNNHRFIGLSFEDAHASSSNTVAAIINGQCNTLYHPRMERVTDQSSYQIQFTSNSIRCGVVGNGFGIVNSNISDSGTQTEVQTEEGRRYSHSVTDTSGAIGTGKSVLQLQSTNTNTARVLATYDTSGNETGKWTGGGDIRTAGEIRLGGSPTAGESGFLTLSKSTQTTVGAAGVASALPANPTGYLLFFIGTTEYAIPYYAKA